MRISIFILILLNTPVLAESSRTKVKVYNKKFPTKEFKKRGYTVSRYSQTRNEMPDTKSRDKVFKESGVEKFISSFDQLDRDMLYMRVKKMSSKHIRNEYDFIPKEILKKLKKLVSESENE